MRDNQRPAPKQQVAEERISIESGLAVEDFCAPLAGFTAEPRAACAATAWRVVRHPHLKHVRLFLPVKTLHASDLEGLAFTVIEEPAGERIAWRPGRVPADLLGAHPRGDAAGWLRQALACGSLSSNEILRLGGQNGYTARMLHSAKAAAGVAVTRDGFGSGAIWRRTLDLPNHAEQAEIA